MSCQIISSDSTNKTIKMRDMKPCQIGRIVSRTYNGHIVLKPQGCTDNTVIDLSDFQMDFQFSIHKGDIEIELLPKGEKITVEFSND